MVDAAKENVSSSSLPQWPDRTQPLVMDARRSFVSFALDLDALHEELLPSADQHVVTDTQALMCSSYTLRDNPRIEVLLSPDQTAFHNCACAFPWSITWPSDEQTPRAKCTLEPQFHPLANPLLPIPFVSSVSYDAEHLGISLAIFFTPVIIAGLLIFFFIMLSIYQSFGTGNHMHTSRIPGILTDVLGHPVRAGSSGSSDRDLSSGANLATTPSAITLVVLRLDALGPDGHRHCPQEKALARDYDKACEVMVS